MVYVITMYGEDVLNFSLGKVRSVPPRSVLKVRASSGASADLTGAVLDRYVFDSGALFLRMGISVEPMKVM